MSKVLLIKPRLLGLEFQYITQPLGLMYISSMLKKSGHETKIHDCAIDYQDLHILKSTMKNWNPDFIGISIIVTELENTKNIMKVIRMILPDTPVTFGGPWSSANPEKAIKEFGADFVVIGEGEVVFPRLIEAINKNQHTDSIPGIASIVNGKIIINTAQQLTEKELNLLPFPAWELLDHNLYKKTPSAAFVGSRPYMTIITSRGCPYECAYCHQTMGKTFRRRSAQSVLAEIEELRLKHQFREFEITDDCFNLDRERMYAILTGIRERFGDVKLHFPNGLRADILEPEDMALFREAGTISASFALETYSPRLQKMIRKNLNIKKAVRAVNASVKAGIYSTGFFMIGFPTETYEEAYKTVKFAAGSTLHRALFHNSIPYAGTHLAKMAADITTKKNLNPQTMNYQNNISAMSDVELHKIFRQAYRRFYLNPKRILGLVMHHPEPWSLPRYAWRTLTRMIQ
jgi:anaerobic magnesium-protoporphyrin IX monomethyl ester cyclase